jgi:hypothetical protein
MVRPSYHQGYARHAGESEAPELWRGLIGNLPTEFGPTGTTVHDLALRANGTITDMSANWVVSGGNYALDFDGVGYLNVADAIKHWHGYNVGSFSCWFRSTTSGSHMLWAMGVDGSWDNRNFVQIAQSSGSYADESLSFALVRGGTVRFFMLIREGEEAYNDSTWHHTTVSIGGPEGNYISIDGRFPTVTFDTGNSATNEFSNMTSPNNNEIGSRTGATHSNLLTGQMRHILVHNRPLLKVEAVKLYQDPMAMFRLRQPVYKAPAAAGGASAYTQSLVIA